MAKSGLTELAEMIENVIFETRVTKWKMAHDKDLLETKMEHEKEMTNISVLQDLYTRKQEEYDQAVKMLDEDYPGLPSEFKTSGGEKLRDDVYLDNKTNLEALNENIKIIGSNVRNLRDKRTTLEQQGQVFNQEMENFWGVNKALQEFEMKKFEEYALKEDDSTTPEVEGLGWKTTAGARKAYRALGDPMTMQNYATTQTDALKAEADLASDTNYAVLQSQLTAADKEDLGDVADRLSYEDADGNEIEVEEEVVIAAKNLLGQNTKDQFFNMLERHPDPRVKDLFETNPNLNQSFFNLGEEIGKVRVLENELRGVTPEGRLDEFTEYIGRFGTKEAAFEFYTGSIQGLPMDKHEEYFQILENQFDEDLGDQYDIWWEDKYGKPFDGKKDVTSSEKVTFTEDIMKQYTDPKDVYAALESLPVSGITLLGGGHTSPLRFMHSLTPIPTESPNYSTATAFGGSIYGKGDSPYYDAFYNSFEDSFNSLIDEKDPFGPNFLWKAGIRNEQKIPGIMARRYGEDSDIYQTAFKIADDAGKLAQVIYLTTVMGREEGSEYWDLVRALNEINSETQKQEAWEWEDITDEKNIIDWKNYEDE